MSNRRKFRSQTCASMDRWEESEKTREEKRREEKRREERRREEKRSEAKGREEKRREEERRSEKRKSQKKEDALARKCLKNGETLCFSNVLWLPRVQK